MPGNGGGSFDLLKKVILIDIFKCILWCMIVWITIFVNAFVILDLNCRGHALQTEGFFIPSITVSHNIWYQTKLIHGDDIG
jgi:hypothetical protein